MRQVGVVYSSVRSNMLTGIHCDIAGRIDIQYWALVWVAVGNPDEYRKVVEGPSKGYRQYSA